MTSRRGIQTNEQGQRVARWLVEGYVTVSAYATVEASSAKEAKEKFEDLAAPSLCNSCSDAGEGTEESGEVKLNGCDDEAHAVDATRCDPRRGKN